MINQSLYLNYHASCNLLTLLFYTNSFILKINNEHIIGSSHRIYKLKSRRYVNKQGKAFLLKNNFQGKWIGKNSGFGKTWKISLVLYKTLFFI